MTYPVALRVRAIRLYLNFVKSLRRLSALLDISKSTLYRWVRQPWIGRKPSQSILLKMHTQARNLITKAVQKAPFSTAHELVGMLREQIGTSVCEGTVRLWRRKLGFTRKKAFQNIVQKDGLDSKRSIFCHHMQGVTQTDAISIDESAFYLDMKPSYGYSRRGLPAGLALLPKLQQVPKPRRALNIRYLWIETCVLGRPWPAQFKARRSSKRGTGMNPIANTSFLVAGAS